VQASILFNYLAVSSLAAKEETLTTKSLTESPAFAMGFGGGFFVYI